jgi:hypothetical protein
LENFHYPNVDKNINPLSGNMMTLESDISTNWSVENITSILISNKTEISNVVDWNMLSSNVDYKNSVVDSINKFGKLQIKYNDVYETTDNKFYYVTLASIETDEGRTIINTIESITDVLELSSSSNRLKYFNIKLAT